MLIRALFIYTFTFYNMASIIKYNLTLKSAILQYGDKQPLFNFNVTPYNKTAFLNNNVTLNYTVYNLLLIGSNTFIKLRKNEIIRCRLQRSQRTYIHVTGIWNINKY